MNNIRPCIVKTGDKTVQAVLHEFFTEAYVVAPSPMVGGAPGGQVSTLFALVEYEDGSVYKVPAECVKFTDITLKVRLNSNKTKEEQKVILDAIKANGGYCPCMLNKTSDTKCMCKAFRDQTSPGPCHCGLYTKEVQHG